MGYVKEPHDIDFAVIPKAASLVKEESMLENRNVTTGGWFWAVGRESKNKQLALKLIRHMTSLENQKEEFSAFGAMPTQKHLLQKNTDRLYLKRWRNRLMQVSIKQIKINRTTVLPFFKDMDKLQQKYYGVLKALCFEPENINSIHDIEQIITKAEEATRK
jgi:ABC-type glycerol-3-phosphate transport system substrate-binding protein